MTAVRHSQEAPELMVHASDHAGDAADEGRRLSAIHAMTPGIIQIPGDVSVGEAARLMHREHAPCVLIKDTDTRIGIMTHTDIVYKVVAKGLNPDDVEARRVMSSPVHSIEFDQPVDDATTRMVTSGVPLLVVTRQQQPIGVISAHDLVFSPAASESRIKATVKVYKKKPEGEAYPALITQLSHLGAFIETAADMAQGARVTLEFTLPESKRPIAVEATVLEDEGPRARDGSTVRRSNPSAGVGVRFTDVALTDQSQISAWIVRSRSKKSGQV